MVGGSLRIGEVTALRWGARIHPDRIEVVERRAHISSKG
jgi:hypothetical protein